MYQYKIPRSDFKRKKLFFELFRILHNWKTRFHQRQFKNWFSIVEKLPSISPTKVDFSDKICAHIHPKLSKKIKEDIFSLLFKLSPWKKGPFLIYGIKINSEWKSDWKWERLVNNISPLMNRCVLDVGCGNGYFLWKMLGKGAKFVVGIDPVHLFYFQFSAIKKLLGNKKKINFLPLKLEQLPNLKCFDTVFSMGVLYHNRFPINHLIRLKNQLVNNGELVLETLIIENNYKRILIPNTKYARMRNVYFIPSSMEVISWLRKSGFIKIRQVHISTTSTNEQRSTKWMQGKSLQQSLQPKNLGLTIEGYPAPVRAIFIAKNHK